VGWCAWAALSGHAAAAGFTLPLGPRPWVFTGLMAAIGLFASWLGTLCWNAASQRLPTTLAGQLIVFETLAALLYAFIWRGALPSLQILAGIGLLCVGVVLGAHAFRPQRLARTDAAPS
jgi:drug/metabolite transporter (DMT)-like permease